MMLTRFLEPRAGAVYAFVRTVVGILFAFHGVLPGVLAVQPGELEEFLAQGLVVLPPAVPAPLGFLGGQRLFGQPGVVGVLRPDLHVNVAEDAPVVARRGLRNHQVPVRQSYDKHR